MPKINLLPWREELRQQRQTLFLRLSLLVVLCAGLLVLAYGLMINHQIDHQSARNRVIQLGIENLNRDIQEVQTLQTQREKLLDWVQIIQNLQADRGNMVHIVNNLAQASIDSLYLTQVSKIGNEIQITGKAKNNREISSLMRHLARSTSFDDPVLTDVNSSQNKQGFSRFTLLVNLAPNSFTEKTP